MHNFKYTLKTIFKNKMLIFWTFAFPIILGTFFNMAFSDIENSEKLNVMDIAIVNDANFNQKGNFVEAFKTLSDENTDEQLFNITYVNSEEEAINLLEDNIIIGYLKIDDKPNVIIKENGIYQTIFNYVTDEIMAQEKISNILANSLAMMENFNFPKQIDANIKDISKSNLSYTMIEFYTLIAMTCLYGGIIGMYSINRTLPNMNAVGKRIAVSPTPKGKIIWGSAVASMIVEIIGLILLFIYTIFALKINYGNNLPLIILLSFVGSFSGLSLGIFVATVFKSNENTKIGIIIAFTMFGCFLSGMMGITMKYIVDKNFPIINKLNPAAMITDGFYALYYYDTLNRYFVNIISLLVFSFLLIGISIICLRRQQYDNI